MEGKVFGKQMIIYFPSQEQQEKFEKKRHKKLTAKQLEDPYEVLGLGHLRWQATLEDIKAACTN